QIKMHTQRFEDTRFNTCPTKAWLEDMWDYRKTQRNRKIDVRLVVYGLFVGLISTIPSIIIAVHTLSQQGGSG
ncbi:MAG: hypothetical protein K9M94_03655, partial [Spirochaetia bacterium]|nr:hypothetical protein [Spirochaetia bacterium]